MVVMAQARRFLSHRLSLNYWDWGNPAAPPLLLVHGGRDHARSWDRIAASLRHDYHVMAPDLRGHGDSDWSPDGDYSLASFVYDLAALVESLRLAPLRLLAHSLGGNIALRFTGLYPAKVTHLVAIEGLGPSPKVLAERAATPQRDRWRLWLEERQRAVQREPRRYPTFAAALRRMQEANSRLSADWAEHLTRHGLRNNADGSFSFKFDECVRELLPIDLPMAEVEGLWAAIACPTLLVYGADSWASNPAVDGRARHFRQARVSLYEDAGHWVHHDQLPRFLDEARAFLR
jgi:pimeloyl-ACP methyl ester carboxylesterase